MAKNVRESVIIILAIVAFAPYVAICQERVIDLSEVNAVVDSWTKAHNDKDLTALDRLFADEVVFYAKQLPKVTCLGIKSKRLRSAKFFHLEIIGMPVVTVYDTDIIRTSFVKRITSGTAVTDYDAYLLLKRIEGRLRIVGESDLITDGKAKFVPDLGKELQPSLLSAHPPQSEGNQRESGNGTPYAFLILGGGGLLGLFVYGFYWMRRENRRQELALSQQASEFYQSNRAEIADAVATFAQYLDTTTGYFTNYQCRSWVKQYTNLFDDLSGKAFELVRLPQNDMKLITMFQNYFTQSEVLRAEFNKRFIEVELNRYSASFDNVEGRKLDAQQRIAIVSDEDNNLVIAGAGSGKTSTIVGKIRYLIDRYMVAPQDILLISFTRKSADTLSNRIGVSQLKGKTFHKIGLEIISGVEEKQQSLFEEKQFRPLLSRFFTELLKDENYLRAVTSYFVNCLKPDKSQFEFETHGDYIQYIKDKNFRTYKQIEIPTRGRTTYKMEVVKSIEECRIANYLLFNGIDYEYEYPYEVETFDDKKRQYRPDFTIKQDGVTVYLEHLGVDRMGNVPSFFAKEGETQKLATHRYQEKVKWAKELHRAHQTILIQTYSYEMKEGTLFDILGKSLVNAGIVFKPKSPEEVWQVISKVANDEVENFTELLGTFITLMKSNNYTIQDVRERNRETKEEFFKRRNDLFLDLVTPLFDRYEKHLQERGEIDFSDMINRATNYVRQGFTKPYKYIVIDEFQDISIGRYQLVKAIRDINPACKLFCVGDDWQSIYRFSGSDITLFKNFESYFGHTIKSKIETTYRFNNPVIELSSDFILKNPNQTRKELKSAFPGKKTAYKIHYSNSENEDDSYALRDVFDQLVSTDPDIEKKVIYLLGRYSFDFERLKSESKYFRVDNTNELISYSVRTKSGEDRTLRAQFLTVHKSKGLEADIVIVLNCNSGKFGFPSEMSDDPLLNLLLSEADQFNHGEERRLFYVAMTRARASVHFITERALKSTFISELEMKSEASPYKKCPHCKKGDVLLRKSGTSKSGEKYNFYGCSNYLYGCEYSRTEWANW